MGVPPAPWVLISLSPQQYGFYSAFMGHFVYFFLGTSRIVTLGPTAIKSLLVSYTFHEPTCAVLLAFLGGCMHLTLGLLLLRMTVRPSCFDGGLHFCSSWGRRHLSPWDALPSAFPSLHSKGCPYVCVLERYPPSSTLAHSA